MPQDSPEPWKNLDVDYKITGGRIVALLEGGGAVVEQHDLTFSEGRSQVVYTNGAEETEYSLEYRASFEVTGSATPYAADETPAFIVLTGVHESGNRMEVRGKGLFGYDDKGSPSGHFEEPPIIIVDDIPDDPTGPHDENYSVERWLEHMENVHPQPSDEYRRALRGAPRSSDC
jgi:hypothetical protein